MSERDLLLQLLDQAYERPSWHGTNLRGSLRRLDPEQAAWRPQPGRHNVWELVLHCAYWKYTVWRRLTLLDAARKPSLPGGATRGSFSLPGSDWFERPVEATAAALRDDLRLLDEWHGKLREAVAGVAPKTLDRRPSAKSRYTVRETVAGIAAHDLYHAGQVQLLKRLYAERPAG